MKEGRVKVFNDCNIEIADVTEQKYNEMLDYGLILESDIVKFY